MKCSLEDCPRDAESKGYCPKHYAAWRRTGNPIAPSAHRTGCSVQGCVQKHRRNGFCDMHSARVKRHADFLVTYPNKMTPEERKVSLKLRQRAYDKTEKGRIASVLKRHRRNAQEDVQLTRDQVTELMKKFSHKCFKCQAIKDLTLDHHVPRVLGGKLEQSNVVILCRKCNGHKADLMPHEFYTPEELISLVSVG